MHARLTQLIAKLKDVIKRLKAFLMALDAVRSKAKAALGVMFYAIGKAVDRVIALLRRIATNALEKMEDYLTQCVELVQLFSMSNVWSDQVAAPFSQISANLTAFETSKGEWTGEAYDSYSKLTSTQDDAATKISQAASEISRVLTNTAAGLITFYAAAAVSTITLVVGLTMSAGAVATGVGAPVGAAGAGLSAAQWVAVIGGGIAALGALVGTWVVQVNNVQSVTLFGGSSPFAHNRWPDGNRQ